jgi:hypothetical protein
LEYSRTEIDRRILAPLIPYVTIGIGLLVLHNAWIAIVSYHLSMAVILILNRRVFALKPILPGCHFKIMILMAFLGGMGGLLLYLLWPLLGISSDINLYFQDIGLAPSVWPYFIAYFILINPWLEEVYWRGYLGSGSKWITVNDVLFSGYHLIVMAGKLNFVWLIIVLPVLILGAWFWRQANIRAKGIAPSIISHLAADSSIICTIYFMT